MFAGANKRGLSLIVDLLIAGGVGVAAVLALDLKGGWAFLAVPAAYFIGFPLTPWQGTPGKRMNGLKITTVAGEPIGVWRSALRFAAHAVSIAFLGLGYVPCFWNARRRTLHDFTAGTVVVSREAMPADIASENPPPQGIGSSLAKTLGLMSFLILVLLVFVVAPLRDRDNRWANRVNLEAGNRVVPALEDYRGRHGRYPATLQALIPEHLKEPPRMVKEAWLLYASTEHACTLAISKWRTSVRPREREVANEYDCGTKQWTLKYEDDLAARHENGFKENLAR